MFFSATLTATCAFVRRSRNTWVDARVDSRRVMASRSSCASFCFA
jgi:hypothetical protein